jgi:hypothetical protein
MYERLTALYAAGRIDATGIANAVTRGWITQQQADAITNRPDQ